MGPLPTFRIAKATDYILTCNALIRQGVTFNEHKMKIFSLPAFLFVLACVSANKVRQTRNPVSPERLPLLISYGSYNPPDSIADFFKVYLQSKGYEMMNGKDAMSMVTKAIEKATMEVIEQGGSIDFDAAMRKNFKPICRVLKLQIFNSDTTTAYPIDSIQFKVHILPARDTFALLNYYYPEKNINANGYSTLKDFADKLIKKRILD